jgi:hypothetical protein
MDGKKYLGESVVSNLKLELATLLVQKHFKENQTDRSKLTREVTIRDGGNVKFAGFSEVPTVDLMRSIRRKLNDKGFSK